MTKSIVISAGHSNVPGRDQGATGNGYIEGHLAVEFRQLLAIELRKLGINPIMDGNNSILSETLNYFRKLISSNNNIICLDIHWNSASPKATGTETLIPANPTKEEIILAEDLSLAVHSCINVPLRGKAGVKTELESHHKKLGWMTLNGTNVLMEICFITNSSDMDSYQDNKFTLAKMVAKVLFNHANGLSRQAGISTPRIAYRVHQVLSNQTVSGIAKMYNVTIEQIIIDNQLTSPDKIYVGQELQIRIN